MLADTSIFAQELFFKHIFEELVAIHTKTLTLKNEKNLYMSLSEYVLQ